MNEVIDETIDEGQEEVTEVEETTGEKKKKKKGTV